MDGFQTKLSQQGTLIAKPRARAGNDAGRRREEAETRFPHSRRLAPHTAASIHSSLFFFAPVPGGPIHSSLLALLPAWVTSYTTTTAGRMQAEKHRFALPTGPIQALSQDTAARSTSHDWDPSEDVLFPMPGSNYRQDGSDEPCVAEAAAAGEQRPPPMQHPACQQPPPRPLHERGFAVRRASMKAHDVLIIHIRV